MASEIELPEGYQPSSDEPYMNPKHLEYFRRRLLQWRSDLLAESGETLERLQEGIAKEGDVVDLGSQETDTALELRTRDRDRKLLSKIDEAVERIEDGSYGFCEETGKPIGLKRLEARPIATLSVEAKERRERAEKQRKLG